MLFMVIERFRQGDARLVAERFGREGRMHCEGSRCFQLMEAEHLDSLKEWIARWADLVDFEIVPVLASDEFWSRFSPTR